MIDFLEKTIRISLVTMAIIALSVGTGAFGYAVASFLILLMESR